MLNTKFLAIEKEIDQFVYERTDEIRSLVLGLVAPGGAHVFMLGEPGIAKSALVTEATKRVTGANMFKKDMTRSTTADELFGVVDILELAKGVYARAKGGTIQEAHLVFLDEVWKGGSTTLNALLVLMNERQFCERGVAKPCPLISLVSASNELPQGEDLNALYDRFHMKHVVHRIGEDSNYEKLIMAGASKLPSVVAASVTLDEIKLAQKEAGAVKLGPTAMDGYKKLRLGCNKQGIRVSDRKWNHSVAVAQGEAWLNGHAEILLDDLTILQHMLWATPEERKKVIEVVYAIACPAMPRALEIVDLVVEQRQKAKNEPDKLSECFKAIRKLSEEIEALTKQTNGKFPQLKDAADKVKRMRVEVGELLVKG